jgi:hypothetical protein
LECECLLDLVIGDAEVTLLSGAVDSEHRQPTFEGFPADFSPSRGCFDGFCLKPRGDRFIHVDLVHDMGTLRLSSHGAGEGYAYRLACPAQDSAELVGTGEAAALGCVAQVLEAVREPKRQSDLLRAGERCRGRASEAMGDSAEVESVAPEIGQREIVGVRPEALALYSKPCGAVIEARP